MPRPVIVENDALRFEVWPHFGGKVSSLIDKADQYELLFTYPAEIPMDAPHYDRPHAEGWCAGWDECLPSIAASEYVGYPYQGITSPDHGEIWSLPTTSVPAKNGVTTVWNGLRFGYRFTRKLHLDGPKLIAEYGLTNLSPFVFRFVWSQHALFGLRGPVELRMEAFDNCRFSHAAHGSVREAKDSGFTWPQLQELDLSRPDSLPAALGFKIFGMKPIAGPAVIHYPARNRSLRIEYEAVQADTGESTRAYWGIWINTGGWAQHRNFAVEPTFGRFDQLDRSIRDNSAASVPALGKVEWKTIWKVDSAK